MNKDWWILQFHICWRYWFAGSITHGIWSYCIIDEGLTDMTPRFYSEWVLRVAPDALHCIRHCFLILTPAHVLAHHVCWHNSSSYTLSQVSLPNQHTNYHSETGLLVYLALRLHPCMHLYGTRVSLTRQLGNTSTFKKHTTAQLLMLAINNQAQLLSGHTKLK